MVKVRDFQKEDAAMVAKLIPQLTRNIFKSEELIERIKKIKDISQTRAVVAEEEGEVVGFAELAWYIIPSKGWVAWVEEVVVNEQYRGQGVGRALMERLIAIAKELNCHQLKLTAANFVAQKLYESLGFEFKETEVMVKTL